MERREIKITRGCARHVIGVSPVTEPNRVNFVPMHLNAHGSTATKTTDGQAKVFLFQLFLFLLYDKKKRQSKRVQLESNKNNRRGDTTPWRQTMCRIPQIPTICGRASSIRESERDYPPHHHQMNIIWPRWEFSPMTEVFLSTKNRDTRLSHAGNDGTGPNPKDV